MQSTCTINGKFTVKLAVSFILFCVKHAYHFIYIYRYNIFHLMERGTRNVFIFWIWSLLHSFLFATISILMHVRMIYLTHVCTRYMHTYAFRSLYLYTVLFKMVEANRNNRCQSKWIFRWRFYLFSACNHLRNRQCELLMLLFTCHRHNSENWI